MFLVNSRHGCDCGVIGASTMVLIRDEVVCFEVFFQLVPYCSFYYLVYSGQDADWSVRVLANVTLIWLSNGNEFGRLKILRINTGMKDAVHKQRTVETA